MLTVLKKWMITVTYPSDAATIIFLSDNHYQNILRKLSDIEFINNPKNIEIKLLETVTGENIQSSRYPG